MKKVFFCLLLMMGMFQWTAAQQQRRFKSTEEKTSEVMAQMQSLKLDDSITTKATVIFTNYFNKQKQIMANYRASENPDRAAALEGIKKLGEERDENLSKILTADQYKKYLSDIQPQISMKRQRNNQ